MSIKLMAFDLDGTLLDDAKNLPGENKAALEAAAAKGIHIVTATGRIYKAVPAFLRELPFTRYYILCNGACVYDAETGETIVRNEIDPETAIRVCEYMDTLPVLYDCYQDNWGWMTRDMYERLPEYVTNEGIYKLMRSSRTPVDDLKEMLRQRGRSVQKLQMQFLDMELKARVHKELLELFPGLLPTSSLPQNIEINSAAANKGRALAGLCEYLGIDTKDAAAFGDGTNDLTMIRDAGTGVAMANGAPEVKAAADMVTDTNENCGVAKAIWKLI